ncbi:MAG: DUF362 domain-containing protein [bacterium]
MADNKVYYDYIENYDLELIKETIAKIFEEDKTFIEKIKAKSGAKILIKPNLLSARHPDKAITTHPVVIKAIVEYLSPLDCEIIIGDSPAGTYNQKILEKLYTTCGMSEVADTTRATLNFDTSDALVNFENGKTLKKSLMLKPAVEADFIINAAKLKTHTLTRLTCTTKNLFGLMPGVLKFRQHLAMPDLTIFAQMLLDICNYFEDKSFHFVDGIIGMEGEGPSGGDPKFAGAILAGSNPQMVDILACHIMGMEINTVPTLKEFKGIEDIEINNFKEIKTYNFNLPPVMRRSIPDKIPKFVQNYLTEIIVPKPLFDLKTCKKCNICIESCPAEIISMENKGPKIKDYKKCIRCYCCQEGCPYRSIHLSTPLVERIFKFFYLNKKKG